MQKKIIIDQKASGFKIDKAILHYLPKLSRRAIRRSLDSGLVSINGKVERFASKKVSVGQIILINIREEKKTKEAIKIQEPLIVYEDSNILAINKPPFVVSQKTVNKNTIDAKSLLLSHLEEQGRNLDFKLILCHRIDKETSGVLLFAKSQKSCDWIMSQFKERKCKKTYEALCQGQPIKKTWEQKNYLSPFKEKSQKVEIVNVGGKTAITSFEVLKKNSSTGISLIEAKPLTGRSHQIRVQLSHNNLSILGDKKYHNEKENNKTLYDHHLLHAKTLEIKPSEVSSPIMITAEPPSLFTKIKQKI